ncbi:CRISPR-associated protein Cas7/Cse4/CasC, subtype TIGR01869 [Leptospira fainei serovar Hurstbridge str. BUT 6]|uniref:CRISPR-associated protein Cas7/Cse4/CasC, subtype TIGR01869 n=1 Tax=Leptospira fainei serovar Hurstbridge str. BUT 6 TaxID=1193011 RepID=S3V0U6_9LEPT|nr:type I-E CRISPR-associated protein Cas7/Cse4/CasC [Leptospira fainei]EPG75058.1 CRISPR-associated protein Cas7/Cse4/CasC, subtype TIGR01869 [Leptospira fainei serovar Hurstbridge str. BUT 6]
MLIEIHILQNHVPSNLNRDDTGSVKDCTFGGVPRARISSQCLKRSIRKSDFFESELKEYLSNRTKYLPEEIEEGLKRKYTPEKAGEIAKKIQGIGSSSDDSEGKKKPNEKEKAFKKTSQLIFFGEKEVKLIIANLLKNQDLEKLSTKDLSLKVHEIITENKIKPVDVALFGRMTTLEKFEEVNASCQVAHAISVNKHNVEFDYFTAVDDLQKKYEPHQQGSGHLSEIELTSACFYKYISVDFDSFLGSIGSDKILAKSAISSLVRAAVLSNPSGKQNSTAAHNPPHFIGIEIKDRKVPVNLANAFVKPIAPDSKLSLNDKSIDALAKYAKRNREAFSLPMKDQAHFVFTEEEGLGDEFSNHSFVKLDDLIQWLEKHTGA